MSLDIPNDDFRKVGTSERIGAAQVLDNNGRERSSSDVFGRRTEMFKYGFCDYDISQMRSEQSKYSEVSSADLNDVVIMHDERWYDKSSAAYFTSDATRYAQTISWKQRHRPMCQIYSDIQLCILTTFTSLFLVLLQYRFNGEGITMGDMFLACLVPISAAVFFLVKFIIFALWYRCTTAGNIVERTSSVYWMRQFCDLILYGFIAYVIYSEFVMTGISCSFEEEGDTKAEQFIIKVKELANPQECDMPLAHFISLGSRKVTVQNQHYYFIGFLVLKELITYIVCVKRASRKLKEESLMTNGLMTSGGNDDNKGGKMDHFMKN